MPDRDLTPSLLAQIRDSIKIERNEICCKLGELNTNLTGGTGTSTTVISGIKKLTGTASFSTATPLSGGTKYRSVSMSVISLTTGTVTVTDPSGATIVSFPGFSTSWNISKDTDGTMATTLTIATTGDAIVIITYTIV